MAKTPIQICTLNTARVAPVNAIEAISRALNRVPDIIALQEVVGPGLGTEDVSRINPLKRDGFWPRGWEFVHVTTVTQADNGFGHTIAIRKASGITIDEGGITTEIMNPTPPGDSEVRKILTLQLRTREGVGFTVRSFHAPWPGSYNSLTTRTYLWNTFMKSMLTSPAPKKPVICMGDLNTSFQYVADIAKSNGYDLAPDRGCVTCMDAEGSGKIAASDYLAISTPGGFTEIGVRPCLFGTDHAAVWASLKATGLVVDASGTLPFDIPGVANAIMTDEEVA